MDTVPFFNTLARQLPRRNVKHPMKSHGFFPDVHPLTDGVHVREVTFVWGYGSQTLPHTRCTLLRKILDESTTTDSGGSESEDGKILDVSDRMEKLHLPIESKKKASSSGESDSSEKRFRLQRVKRSRFHSPKLKLNVKAARSRSDGVSTDNMSTDSKAADSDESMKSLPSRSSDAQIVFSDISSASSCEDLESSDKLKASSGLHRNSSAMDVTTKEPSNLSENEKMVSSDGQNDDSAMELSLPSTSFASPVDGLKVKSRVSLDSVSKSFVREIHYLFSRRLMGDKSLSRTDLHYLTSKLKVIKSFSLHELVHLKQKVKRTPNRVIKNMFFMCFKNEILFLFRRLISCLKESMPIKLAGALDTNECFDAMDKIVSALSAKKAFLKGLKSETETQCEKAVRDRVTGMQNAIFYIYEKDETRENYYKKQSDIRELCFKCFSFFLKDLPHQDLIRDELADLYICAK